MANPAICTGEWLVNQSDTVLKGLSAETWIVVMSKFTGTQVAVGRSHKKTEDMGGKKNREAELCRAVETVIQWEVRRSQSQQAESEAKWDMVQVKSWG